MVFDSGRTPIRSVWRAAGAITLLIALPLAARAHLAGIPTIAWFVEPAEVGIVVDDSYTFRWTDYDDAEGVVGDTRIDFFYTDTMPPTYRMGTVLDNLVGIPIVKAIPEADVANEFVWDTSGVPSGTYFLWSMAHDAPFKMVAFSGGAVTVAHEGDPIHPAIVITDPDREGHVAEDSYTIRFEAFDPDGSGTVRLEATTSPTGGDRILLAEGLAPSAGSFEWDTSELEQADWSIFVRIEDARGLSHEAWGRFFVRVSHPGKGEGGGGAEGGSGGDAGGQGGIGGTGGTGGTGGSSQGGSGLIAAGDPEGCSCASGGQGPPAAWLVGLPLLWLQRRRRQADPIG